MNLILLAAILLIYLLAVAYLSYLGFRQTKTSKDYLVAGRSIHPVVMTLSYGATFISTAAIVGFGGVAGVFGLGLLWLVFLNVVVGIFIAFLVFGKRTRTMADNLDARTFPELLGKRFESRLAQRLGGFVIFLAMPLYAAVVLIGIARFIEITLVIDYRLALLGVTVIVAAYVVAGGLKGVMYTDALQGGVMFVSMLLLLVGIYLHLGGPMAAHNALGAIAHLVPDTLQAQGHRGWTVMPALGSPWWWTLISTLVLGVGIGVLAQPQLVVRFMAIKSVQALNRGVWIGSAFILVVVGGAFLVGTLSNVYFHQTQGQIAIAAANGNPDLIIPQYIAAAMPTWFSYLFVVTLLSAAMSTLSSQFHTMGTALSHDCLTNISHPGHASLWLTRFGVALSILISVALGYGLPPGIIARGTAIFFSICAATFLPTYVAALFWKRATQAGVLWSILMGLISSLLCLMFLHQKEAVALGISQFLFGKAYLIEAHPWPFIDPILLALPISAMTLVIVSQITPTLSKDHIAACFKRLSPGVPNRREVRRYEHL